MLNPKDVKMLNSRIEQNYSKDVKYKENKRGI